MALEETMVWGPEDCRYHIEGVGKVSSREQAIVGVS